ncbi:hypothetical protein [uncultured Acinetobacter sp.]|uniref:hypothetical protein n=1 Tax=uncultured Acinetobacter sp. TaxID=165433 RepID=UPI00258E0023|nr:hypothetical protein [uncultured Acinetobacter sp.]
MKKIYSFLALLTFSSVTCASVQDYLPEAKLQGKDVSPFNVGLGVTQQLAHVNGEWVNPYGIAYLKAGAYLNGDHTFGGQVGYRYPYYLTGKNQNGYYLGVYAGTLESRRVDNDYTSRLGGGVDLAYVWLNKDRISTFSVGIGAAEALKNTDGSTVVDTKPQLQFAYTLSFGL